MKKGYGVFGKAYEVMFRNDIHDEDSIDHYILRNMILLDEEVTVSHDKCFKRV